MRAKFLTTFLVLSLCILAVRAGKMLWGPQGRFVADKSLTLKSKGNPSAPVWIVEYVDFQCESCRLASMILDEYTRFLPDQIYLQVKFFPLRNHLHSFESARFVECASRQGQFWPFYHLVFERQEEWTHLPAIRERFLEYAGLVGLDKETMSACVEDPQVQELVAEEKAAGEKLGINMTPTFFFNGEMTSGRQGFVEFLDRFLPDGRKYFTEEATS